MERHEAARHPTSEKKSKMNNIQVWSLQRRHNTSELTQLSREELQDSQVPESNIHGDCISGKRQKGKQLFGEQPMILKRKQVQVS